MAYTPTDWECGQTVTAEKLNNIERGVAEVNSEYTPTTWQCGDVITAEKMNKIEQGIANAGGGSSDFSTAQVTIVNNTDAYQSVSFMSNYISNHAMTEYISAVRITDEYGASNDYFTKPLGVNGGESINVDVYLISGKNFSAVANGEDVTVTLAGQAEESYVVAPDESQLPVILITGDCTITIS